MVKEKKLKIINILSLAFFALLIIAFFGSGISISALKGNMAPTEKLAIITYIFYAVSVIFIVLIITFSIINFIKMTNLK